MPPPCHESVQSPRVGHVPKKVIEDDQGLWDVLLVRFLRFHHTRDLLLYDLIELLKRCERMGVCIRMFSARDFSTSFPFFQVRPGRIELVRVRKQEHSVHHREKEVCNVVHL